MPDDDELDKLTLTERLKKSRYLARELSEHLTQAYLPKLGNLKLATKELDEKKVTDQQVFDCLKAVLQAEEFTDALQSKLKKYLDSVRAEMTDLLFQDESSESSAALRQPDFDFDGSGVFD